MTKQHNIGYYQDGHVRIAFCKVCSAEGVWLAEDCPKKIVDPSEKSLDEKNQPAK